jgi:RES domain-containing protein
VIQDNPNPNTVSIGTSYTRYWLPVYALAIPFAASYILRFVDSIGRWRHLALIGMIALMTLSSVMIAVLDTNEGLAANRTAAIEYKHLADRAVSLTPSRAVIITGHADKIFFPERNVIVSVDAPSQLFKLRTLITKVPVYLYISSSVESPTAAKKAWSRRGIQLTDEQQLAEHEYLYRLLDSTYQTF